MAARLFSGDEPMSGICGICQPGRVFRHGDLRPMLEAISLPGDHRPAESAGTDVGLGVVPRWPGQQVAGIPGVRLVLDGDLVQTNAWDATLARTGLATSQMTLA